MFAQEAPLRQGNQVCRAKCPSRSHLLASLKEQNSAKAEATVGGTNKKPVSRAHPPGAKEPNATGKM